MNNKFDKLKIGYVPYSRSLDRPGDRRRFCYYAKKRNIRFEIADPAANYDVVIVTERGDLSIWSKYKNGNAKIVYDFIDSYLAIPRYDLKGLLRGLAKYVSGESRHLELNYWKAIERMCKRCDAVICTTDEQKKVISGFCGNAHIILDFHGDTVRNFKENYSAGSVFNLVWEGLPYNVSSLSVIKDVLTELNAEHRIALHIVTDLQYNKYMGRFGARHTADVAKKIFDDVHVHAWDEKGCSSIITGCDMALIPIPLNDPLAAGKPENKLLLFWRMGMPVIVSATPAYLRAMEKCGLPMACRAKAEWRQTIKRYINDENIRREAGIRGKAFAEENYGEEKVFAKWDELFESIL